MRRTNFICPLSYFCRFVFNDLVKVHQLPLWRHGKSRTLLWDRYAKDLVEKCTEAVVVREHLIGLEPPAY